MFHKGIARGLLAAALCAVGFAATAAEPEAVQLWEGGPYWATVNVGTAEQGVPAEYGALYNFADAAAEVAKLGEGWRLPTQDELQGLVDNCNGVWDATKKGHTFTSKSDSTKSIFLPAAGYNNASSRESAGGNGYYWSSSEAGANRASRLFFDVDGASMGSSASTFRFSVRAVRDTPLVTGPSVKVDKVESGEPWSKITVNYTLGGVDAATKYKVAFDVTAGGQTASVTNDAAKLTDGAATQEIDTATIFGKEVVDTKAKVKVSLIAIKPKEIPAVQLWEGGPYWATVNVGTAEQGVPEVYGGLYKFDGDEAKNAAESLGDGWRLPTEDEFQALITNCGKGTWTEQNGVKGRLFTSKSDSTKSIFLPAAGNDNGLGGRLNARAEGRYWSSTAEDASYAWNLRFYISGAEMDYDDRAFRQSVRAVRDAK